MRSLAVIDLDAEAGGAQVVGHLASVVDVAVGDGDDLGLHRRQPEREGAGVVLDEHAEEALHRAEQGAVHHVRAVLAAVLADVGDVEALRQVEVELDRGALPLAAEGVEHLDVDLRAVEDRAALVDVVRQAAPRR